MIARKKKREKRPELSAGQVEYLRSGDFMGDVDSFLWSHPGNREKVRETFEAIRADFAPGHFEWAEKEFSEVGA